MGTHYEGEAILDMTEARAKEALGEAVDEINTLETDLGDAEADIEALEATTEEQRGAINLATAQTFAEQSYQDRKAKRRGF